MEGVAWFMHKYVMHGFAWKLHQDHHKRDHFNSKFELNDVFFIFFAVLSISSFLIWQFTDVTVFLGIGIGIVIYGAVYFFIHDLFIHQRIKVLRKSNNKYLRALRKAHKIHHKHLTKEDGECFGMLWVPFKYYMEEFKKK
jgi:beta-carotene 3-hydroxylase